MKLSGDVLGIPYDFSLKSLRQFRRRWWNKDDERIIVPKAFGLGYDINLYQLRRQQPLLFNLLMAGLAAVVIAKLLGLADGKPNEAEPDSGSTVNDQ